MPIPIPPDPGAAAGPPPRHSVWGRVVAPNDGAVPAEVFWVAFEHAGSESVPLFDAHKVAHADEHGRFWAPDLPAGPCLLVPDFERLGVKDGTVAIGHGTRVDVPLGEGEEVTLRFPHLRTEFGSIHGVLRDPIDMRPGSRVHIALMDEEGRILRETDAGTNGVFAFPFLPSPARYRVAFWGTRTHEPGTGDVEVGKNVRIDMKVDHRRRPPGPRGAADVTVRDRFGVPVRGARVVLTLEGSAVPPRDTGVGGVASFEDLPCRPRLASASAEGFWPDLAEIPPGPIEERVQADIQLGRALNLRIAVRDAVSGRPLRHANVLVRQEGYEHTQWGGVLGRPDQPPRPYVVGVVRPGPVHVAAESPGHRRRELDFVIPDEIEGDVLGIEMPLDRVP